MSGTLYICGTPIGNLKDITLRAIETLKMVDIIAAEDTRHTLKLLNHYDIKKTLESYHEHNKEKKGVKLLKYLEEGKNIALVTDAGMPCISDPGEDLIKLCYDNNIKVTVVPGPSAVTSAISLSGLNIRSYCFEGFLPNNKKKRREIIETFKKINRTIIIYEAPHNLKAILEELLSIIGNRNICIVKEITKKYENIYKGNIKDILSYYDDNFIKGEIVLIIQCEEKETKVKNINEENLEESLENLINKGYDFKSAIKEIAKDKNIKKREIYKYFKIK